MTPRPLKLDLGEWGGIGEAPGVVCVRQGKRKPDNTAEELFAFQCKAYRLPTPERQFTFAKAAMQRQWRFDFSWREFMVAVEIQGVVVRKIGGKVYTMGGHADVQGMRNDHEKHNAAILLGWAVLQFMQDEVKPGRAIQTTMQVLNAKGWTP